MDDPKIDLRLKEIDEEVVLLTNYISESLEKKLEPQINDLKESLKKIEVNGIEIKQGETIPSSISDDIFRLKESIDNLTAIKGNGGFQARDENLSQIVESSSGSIMEKLGSIDIVVQNTIRENTKKQNEQLNTLLGNLEKLTALAENTQNLCTMGDGKVLGNEIADIRGRVEKITGEITGMSQINKKALSSVEDVVQASEKKNTLRQEELKKSLVENIGNLKTSTDKVLQLCAIDENKQLGSEILSISSKLETLAKELPNVSKSIQKEVLLSNNGVQNSVQQTAKQQNEIRDILLKEIKNINDNAEVIRRMCSTDQEKFMGSVTTSIYNKIEELTSEIPELHEKLKTWIFAIDKNLRTLANQSAAKQEETKKILLYDLDKLNDSAEILKIWCTTKEDRPLGSEIIQVSDKVEKIFNETPYILEKVTSLADKLDKVSSEVIMMRWFVIGAVAVSLIVLIASFTH